MKNILITFIYLIISITTYSLDFRPLIVLVDFYDYKHSDIHLKEDETAYTNISYNKNFYNDLFFKSGFYSDSSGILHLSAKEYYKKESGGSFNLIGTSSDIYGWYQAPNPIAFYGKNFDLAGDKLNSANLIRFAIDSLIDEGIDFSKYDLNNDKIIDGLIIIYAGKGEHLNNSLGDYAIWPHFSTISDISRGAYATFSDKSNNQWIVDKYLLVPQDASIDLYTHEIGHFLGLSDLYGKSSTIGYWSLMSNLYCGHDYPGSKMNSIGGYHLDNLNKVKLGDKWVNKKNIDIDSIKNTTFTLYKSTNKKKTNLIQLNLKRKSIIPPRKKNTYYSDNYLGVRSRIYLSSKLPNSEDIYLNFTAYYETVKARSLIRTYIRPKGTVLWKKIKEQVPFGIDHNMWFDLQYDLSKYKNQEVEIMLQVIPSFYNWKKGIFISDIDISSNEKVPINNITTEGFYSKDSMTLDNYLLFEYRVPIKNGVDSGLLETPLDIPYIPGLIIWDINEDYNSEGSPANLLPLSPGNIFVDFASGRVPFKDLKYIVSSWSATVKSTLKKVSKESNGKLYREVIPGSSVYSLKEGISLEIISEDEEKVTFILSK